MPTKRRGSRAKPVRNQKGLWRGRSVLQRVVLLTAAFSALVVAAIGGVVWWANYQNIPLPIDDRCVATVAGQTTTLNPDQAYYAALISGISIKRGLEPRAASIALATAYQESGIRNLDYGHADSLGLFQQRPSQGWGTTDEILDPWYSSTQFYKALVKVKDWAVRDLNDVAQAVQRSGYPQAYRKHVTNARALASALTGETPAAFTCSIRNPPKPDPAGLADYLRKTFGKTAEVTAAGNTVTVDAATADTAWAVAHAAVGAISRFGLDRVAVGDWTWRHDPRGLAAWHGPGLATGPTRVVLTLAA